MLRGDALLGTRSLHAAVSARDVTRDHVTPDAMSWTWGYVRQQFCSPHDQSQQQQLYSRAGLAALCSFGMLVDDFVFTVIIPVM